MLELFCFNYYRRAFIRSIAVVGGQSIPHNILNGNWNRKIFKDPNLSPIEPIAKKLLGSQQFQRYRTPEKLMADIDSCLGELV